jgi:hypothetical protein
MKMTEQQFRSHRNYYDGYCIHCDAITRDGGTEPDAKNYECFECERMSCLGMDYALMGDYFQFVSEEDADGLDDSAYW